MKKNEEKCTKTAKNWRKMKKNEGFSAFFPIIP